MVATLTKSSDLIRVIRRLAPGIWKNPRQRIFIQKVGKVLDNKIMDLASQEAELQALRGFAKEEKVKKRKKVERTDLNRKFATITDVIRIRKAMEATIIISND